MKTIELTSSKPPSRLKIPLDAMLHYSLGQMQSAHQEPSEAALAFLHGTGFDPITVGRFLGFGGT